MPPPILKFARRGDFSSPGGVKNELTLEFLEPPELREPRAIAEEGDGQQHDASPPKVAASSPFFKPSGLSEALITVAA